MRRMRSSRLGVFVFIALAITALASVLCQSCRAQAALLLEEPYGVYGTLNPTGHNAIYLARVCAETPVKLRRCRPGELGSVISRYEGIDGYDWVAMPLIPYLYSVEDGAAIPSRVNREAVDAMREEYRDDHFHSIGLDQSGGSFVRDGWTQLVGVAYERRIYAFRFNTTPEQDDALIARLNAEANQSHFHMLFRNCADFAREVLNTYFPGTFKRSFFPDAGVTTPKQTAHKLVRYAQKHPELDLTVLEIPQVPGYRWHSHENKDIAESFVTTVYVVPIALVNPYLAGGIFLDYLVRGRYRLIPRDPDVVGPENDFAALTAPAGPAQNPDSAELQASSAAGGGSTPILTSVASNFGLRESKAPHE